MLVVGRRTDGLTNIWIDDGWSVRYYILDERFSRYSPVSVCVFVCLCINNIKCLRKINKTFILNGGKCENYVTNDH